MLGPKIGEATGELGYQAQITRNMIYIGHPAGYCWAVNIRKAAIGWKNSSDRKGKKCLRPGEKPYGYSVSRITPANTLKNEI